MNSVPNSAAAGSPSSNVSYTLRLTLTARRAVARAHTAAKPLVDAAVQAYRRTGNPHDGTRALRYAAELAAMNGGGLRA